MSGTAGYILTSFIPIPVGLIASECFHGRHSWVYSHSTFTPTMVLLASQIVSDFMTGAARSLLTPTLTLFT